MSYRIVTGAAALLFPLIASADTLIMKDGTQIRGNFENANSTRMSFTEYNGSRRDFRLSEIQELRFGNDGASNGPAPGYREQPGAGNPNMVEDLDRLGQDLRAAMENSNLRPEQRQTLEDARETLRAATQQSRNGRPLNQRNIRLALDSIRNNTEGMQRGDRDRLNDDVRRLNASMGGQQGRDY